MQANYWGLKAQAVNWQHLNIYKKILGKLQSEGRLNTKYSKAACTILWPLAHWIAKHHPKEAQEVVNWIYELDPEFAIPEKGVLGIMYNYLGFKNTERLLSLKRNFNI
jgi:hypothetical protein